MFSLAIVTTTTRNHRSERRGFDFASHFLLPNNQLKRRFFGKSMVRLVQFKESFGISLAAMVYRARQTGVYHKN